MVELCEAARALKIVGHLLDLAQGSGVIDLPALKQATTAEHCNCEDTK